MRRFLKTQPPTRDKDTVKASGPTHGPGRWWWWWRW